MDVLKYWAVIVGLLMATLTAGMLIQQLRDVDARLTQLESLTIYYHGSLSK